MAPDRVERHIEAFNAAVGSGEWSAFAEHFTTGAVMRFIGLPVGPFAGRTAIAEAYAAQPPTDTIAVRWVESDGDVDTVGFGWSAGGTGTMRLTWAEGLVETLEVAFDG
jgi:hypothetical protein